MNKAIKVLFISLVFSILAIGVSAEESNILNYYVTTYFPSSGTVFDAENISDDNVYTSAVLPAGLGIELNTLVDSATDSEYVGYVYVKFKTTPVPYSITYNNTNGNVAWNTGEDEMVTVNAGKHGFLHDLTVIDANVSSIMISSEYDMEITDIFIYSKGELPANIQRWEQSLSECDLLCFPTHADDESLFMGALIAESVARGKLVQVVLICNDKKDPHRPHELLDAVWTLGVKFYPIMGSFPDHYSLSLQKAKTQYDTDEMRGFIVESIRRTKPSVIVGHDINGEYGHGAHMLTSLLLRESIELVGDENSYPESACEYGVHEIQKLFLHLYEENNITLDVKRQYDTLGGRSPFDLAVDAYDCHKSQHVFVELFVSTEGEYDCSSFGLYHSTVGYNVSSGDIFEGTAPIAPKVSATIETDPEPAASAVLLSATPEHIAENTIPESVRDSFSRTDLSFCILLAAVLILYAIITTRRR